MLEDFVKAGADHLLVQCEPASTIHLHRVLSRIRELGARPGVVIDPGSPIAFVEHVLHLCDVVLAVDLDVRVQSARVAQPARMRWSPARPCSARATTRARSPACARMRVPRERARGRVGD
jgi:hypothetical protein